MTKEVLHKKLQKTLRTDIGYLFKGGMYLSIGHAIAALSGFLLTVGLAYFLEPAEYGLYTYILSIGGLVGAFTLTGMDTAVAQAIAKGFDRTLITGFWVKCVWSIPPAILAMLAGGYYLYRDDATLGYSLLIIGITLPFLYATSLYGSYLNGKRQFKRLAFDNILRNILIALSILTTAYLTQNVIFIILTFFLVNTCISVFRFWYLVHTVKPQQHENDHASISYGKHLSLMDAFSVSSTFLDKIIVFQYLGATSLALYALALAPTKQMQGVSKIIRSLVLPKFTLRSREEIRESLPRKTWMFFLASVSISIIYCIFAPFFFKAFFPKYESVVLYSQVLSLSLWFMPFILHLQALTALNEKKTLYMYHTCKPIIRIALLILLIPPFGIWGAISAFLLYHIITNIILMHLFKQSIT